VRSGIEKNISEPDLSVEKMANELGMSRSQLFRKFGILFDRSPNELIRRERLKYARNLLLKGEHNVNEVADMSGFSSTSYFITSFKKQYGKTPARLLKERR
jgi:AraC-like DNA-binding protein